MLLHASSAATPAFETCITTKTASLKHTGRNTFTVLF